MSRKRESQREHHRELARQLGVSGKDVPAALLDHERVTEPTMAPVLSVDVVKRSFFSKSEPGALHLALFVVDQAGARCCRRASFACVLARGAVPLLIDDAEGDEGDEHNEKVVRYRRPGHFVLLAVLCEGGSAQARRGAGHDLRHLENKSGLVHVDGAPLTLASTTMARLGVPTALTFASEQAFVFSAAAAVSVPAVGRVKTTLSLPLHSADHRLKASADVDVRL